MAGKYSRMYLAMAINRAPVLTVVAQRLGYDEYEALTRSSRAN
jgi:hypothetical protein